MNMNAEEIIDYAMPLMKIERFAKQIHDCCLHNKYEEAEDLIFRLGAETRVLMATLAIMQGKDLIRRPA